MMSIENKIKNAKPTDWLSEGIPKWQIRLIVFWAKLKVKIWRKFNKINKQVENSNRFVPRIV